MSTSSLRFGYARVSTKDQSVDLQVDALKRAQCQRVYSEFVSSGKTRPQLEECLRTLRAGDTLVVWRMDRLARSLIELMHITNNLQTEGVNFESLTENINTSGPTGKLTLQIFGAFAEFERNLIRERTLAGLEAARKRGSKGGRKPKVTEKMRKEMLALYHSKEVPINDICKRYDISKNAFYTSVLCRVYGAKKVKENTT